MSIKRENAFVEGAKFVRELNESLADKDNSLKAKKLAKINEWKDNYYKIINDRRAREVFHGRLLEAARNDAFGTCIKAIYITALDEYAGLSEDEAALAESIVDKWIQESGGATEILTVSNQKKSYLLARLAQISEQAARRAVTEVEAIEEADDNPLDGKEEEKTEEKEETKEEVKDGKEEKVETKEEEVETEEEPAEESEPEDGDFEDEDLDKDTDDDSNDDEDEASDLDTGDDEEESKGEEEQEISSEEEEEVSDEEEEEAGDDLLDSDPEEDEDDNDVENTEEDSDGSNDDDDEEFEVDSEESSDEDEAFDLDTGEEDEESGEESEEDSEEPEQIYKDLENEQDVKRAIHTIHKRVADAEEKFIQKNADDKKQVDALLHKLNDNIKTVEEIDDKDDPRSQAANERALMIRRQINDIAERGNKSVFDTIVYEVSKINLQNKNSTTLSESAIESISTDIDESINTARIMYGFLETLNTLRLEDVNEAYIKRVITEIR